MMSFLNTNVLHTYICSLITMLGGFLQLKQGVRNESLFYTNYLIMVSLIVALIAYNTQRPSPNLDLAESIINKSLLFGTLALILEVVILVPGLGLVALFFWVVWFVNVVAEYVCEYLKTFTSRERSTKVLHKYICSLITMMGVFIQLKQGARNESLFDTNYSTMVSLIVAILAYGGSLIGSRGPNSCLAESIINKISLLFGTLALILEVVILVPGLGLATLFFWVVWFVSVVAEYACEYLEVLYKSAIASAVHTFGKLKEHLKMIIRRFTTEPEEQTDEEVTSTTHKKWLKNKTNRK
ncbi:hypothetical protein DVH24_037057 [Malus domestica]|uniref:Uncharacterized protein n=1 Tax=Malus domestica TaxID=3750 RepID=A0A498HJY7_MALDO|nr:hypothetical protein DVH24_037057 [Malus domestica]